MKGKVKIWHKDNTTEEVLVENIHNCVCVEENCLTISQKREVKSIDYMDELCTIYPLSEIRKIKIISVDFKEVKEEI